MRLYSDPLVSRVKVAISEWINVLVDCIRRPVRRAEVQLITGGASPEKALEVEGRLRYLLAHLAEELDVRPVASIRWWEYLLSAGVAAADTAALDVFAHRHFRWVVDLDFDSNPNDGWDLMRLGVALSGENRRIRTRMARRTFLRRISQLSTDGPLPVYLFGTGPSLGKALNHSFSDGIRVVCNTIVRDAELWHHLKPDFLVAADAIYHFGHTPHAIKFRADALRRLKESDGRTVFVYPSLYDVIVRSEFREVESLLIPIPYGQHTDVTVNLSERFYLPYHIGNILNVLLLPLGCTLSHDIRLWGFDGRAPDDQGFWANSALHAYPELMQSLRDAHPAFFANQIPAGNESQYVEQVHGDWLDGRLTEAESRGYRFRMLHPSWTPTFRKRYINESPNSA